MNSRQPFHPLIALLVAAAAFPVTAEPLSPEFTPVFDGRSLAGFTPVGPGRWQVAGGEIAAGGSGWLQMDLPWQDGRLKYRFRCDPGCDTGILLRGRAQGDAHDGIYMSLAPQDLGSIALVTVNPDGSIVARQPPQRGPVPSRPSTFAGASTLATPGAPPPPAPDAGGPRAAPPPPPYRAADWNYLTIAIRGGVLSAQINGKPVDTGAPLVGINDFGVARFRAVPGLRLKDIAFEDFTTRTEPRGAVGAGFAMQRLTELYYGESAAIADINRDGQADIVAGPLWFEGPDFRRSHEYALPVTGNVGLGYLDFAGSEIADWNGDGWPDILVQEINRSFPVYLYLNPGNQRRHWARHLVVPYTRSETHLTCDLFGDGRRVLVAAINGRLGWLFPGRDGPTALWAFHGISEPGTGDPRNAPTQHGMGCGDINGDGRTDVIGGNGWWEQQPDAGWRFHTAAFDIYTDRQDGGGGADMFAYDVNGDGRADVVSGLRGHGFGLAWFEQQADGGWQRHMIMNSPDKAGPDETIAPFSELHVVRLADMDGDGLKDIITGKRWWSHGDLYREEGFQAPPVLYWFKLERGGGKVRFIPHLIHDNSGIGTSFAVGDVNGDGRQDIVTSARHGSFLFVNRMGAAARPRRR